MSQKDSSPATVEEIASHAAELAIGLAWDQWSELNPAALRSGERSPVRSIIDPEALLLATGALWEQERRLLDIMGGWAKLGSRLLSVQRVRTLLKEWADTAPRAAEPFAQMAYEAGDQRWKTLMPATREPLSVRPGKGPEELRFDRTPTVLLRVRAAFGVSSKADVFTYLLSLQGEQVTAAEIADAVAFSKKIAREAADDLVLAGFAEVLRGGYPVHYAVRPGFAPTLVSLIYSQSSGDVVPPWRRWSHVYGILLEVARWPERAKGSAGPLVLSMWARDTYERHRAALAKTRGEPGIDIPDPRAYPGAEYLRPFQELLTTLATKLT